MASGVISALSVVALIGISFLTVFFCRSVVGTISAVFYLFLLIIDVALFMSVREIECICILELLPDFLKSGL
jgi:hypothetical protein